MSVEKRFEEILEVVNGKNQKKIENPNGRYPIYGSGGIMGYADDYICNANTVVIGRKGSINNPIFVEEPFWNVDTAFGLVAKEDILLPKYLYFFCKYFNFEQLNTTVTIPSLTKANLLKIKLELPMLNKQKRIVDVLESITKIMLMRKQQISYCDDLIKAQFVDMFGDPIINPKRWHCECIAKVCRSIYGGGTPSKNCPEYFEGNIPWVSPKDMKSSLIIDSTEHITKEAIDQSATHLVPANSVLMVIRSGILKHTLPVAINNVQVAINQDMKAFVPSSLVTSEYLMYYLKIIETDVLSGVRSVTADNINFKDFQKRKIIIPPINLQRGFSAFVQQINKSKVAIQKSLDETQLLFDCLMQKYFG